MTFNCEDCTFSSDDMEESREHITEHLVTNQMHFQEEFGEEW